MDHKRSSCRAGTSLVPARRPGHTMDVTIPTSAPTKLKNDDGSGRYVSVQKPAISHCAELEPGMILSEPIEPVPNGTLKAIKPISCAATVRGRAGGLGKCPDRSSSCGGWRQHQRGEPGGEQRQARNHGKPPCINYFIFCFAHTWEFGLKRFNYKMLAFTCMSIN